MDAATIDLAAVRARFPSLGRAGPGGAPVVHADAPGGTQVVDTVIAAMAGYLRTSNANAHGSFPSSRETDELCADVRRQVAAFVGGRPDGIVFGPNMTTLTFQLARALAPRVGTGDDLVCTRLDHDANVSPWLRLAERTGASVRFVELAAANGTLDVASLQAAVTPRTRVVAFPAASNALGTLVDPAPFVAAARAVGALTFVDAVHAAPHVPLDQRGWAADVLVCSPYKFFGPHAGLLSADPALLAELRPDKVRPAPDTGPERWQNGTASFEAIAGIGAALRYLDELGMTTVRAHEVVLAERFLDGLRALPHVHLHGPRDPGRRTPTFAVTVEGLTSAAVAERLSAVGIWAWAGHYYAVEPMRALGLLDAGGAVRIGFVHYHGPDDVDRVLDALAALAG